MQRRGESGQPVKGRRGLGPDARKAPTAPTSTCYSVEEFDRVNHELAEAREREAATGEVLKVISRSAFDLQAVFDTLVESVARLCRADRASIRLVRDGFFHHVASYGYTPEQDQYMNEHPVPAAKPDRGSIVGRVLSAGKAVQIEDTKADPEFKITNVPGFENVHTTFGVPLLREGKPIGVLVLMRGFVEMFTNKQIELAETFAAQAVIAIENTRLLNELRQRTDDLTESLQQQTATADVLKVISRSTFDLQTVLDTLVESAARLCDADIVNIWRPSRSAYRLAAVYQAVPSAHREYLENISIGPNRGSCVGRTLLNRDVVHIDDILSDPEYSMEVSKLGGYRTMLGVPLLREGTLVGVIALVRFVRRPFTEKQIELVKTFADQAVIAIENVRLFEAEQQRTRELSEALEQQTATSEVLKVISSSPGELEPVFNAMLANAVRICEAKFGNLFLIDGNNASWAAGVGTPPKLAQYFTQSTSFRPTPGSHLDRVMKTRQLSHSADDTAEVVVGAAARLGGARSSVCVPMLKDEALVGAIFIYRTEVRPFTDKQIALVQNFAAQAVIAIENTRLLSELRESLEQQTATSEVLSVISSSPGELEPVFHSMLENATRICEAKFGTMLLREGDAFRTVALHNAPPAFVEERRRSPLIHPHPTNGLGRLAATRQVVHIADIRLDRAYLDGTPSAVAIADIAGARTVLLVPMLKDNELVGSITIYRQEVRPFTDKQIALMTNFAAQAVIAIENTRLLNELRESLEQQTATSEVLKVISSSPGESQSVFDVILANATDLCDAKFASLRLCEGDLFRTVSLYNAPTALGEHWRSTPLVRPHPELHP